MINYNTIISNNPYPEDYNKNNKYNYYRYPFTYKLSNNKINYLDYCYDFFKDDILLDENDKIIKIVKENYKDLIGEYRLKTIDFIEDKNLYFINSGGGITYLNFKLRSADVTDKLEEGIKVIKTFDDNKNQIRKIILYNGRILKLENDNVILVSLNNLDFTKNEISIELCKLDNSEEENYTTSKNIIDLIINNIRDFGKFLAIKVDNKFERINFSDLDFDYISKNINLYDENDNLLSDNINENENSYYIIRRFGEIPEFCKCNIINKEYDINYFIYKKLNSSEIKFNSLITSINLAEKLDKLQEFNLFNNNNYEYLNKHRLIIQILDTNYNITKMIYFSGQKYIINNQINHLNELKKVNENNNLYINKHEKRAEILMREKIDINDNWPIKYEKKFNLRLDLNITLSTSIQNTIIKINNLIKKTGIIETHNINYVLIKKRIFNKNNLETIGNIENIENINFNSSEHIFTIFDKNRTKIITLPITNNLNNNNIISSINYYLYNKNCILKLYDINMNLIKLGICKNRKFIFKENGKNLKLDSQYYLNNFDEYNWNLAQDNYIFDLDEIYLSIEINKGVEILFLDVNAGNTMSTFDDLLKSFGYSNNFKDYNFRFIINKINFNTSIRFYDYDNNVTKKFNFTFNPIPNNENAILLYDNPIQYIECYNNNSKYNCYHKNTLILSIYIPNGMRGIYSYKINTTTGFI